MRLGDFRFHLRRFETVLSAVWKAGMEADKVPCCCYIDDVLSTVNVRTIFLMLCQLLNKRICYVRTGIALRLPPM